MLKEVKQLHGWPIHALDGEIGHLDELLFDDESWMVRYLIVDTGNWLTGRQVLISPLSLGFLDWDQKVLHLNLTREKIEHSPSVATDQPVSRQWEIGYYDYHVLPYYWSDGGTGGAYSYPGAVMAMPIEGSVSLERDPREEPEQEHASLHLQSARDLSGYGISATDGHIGHLKDFLVDVESWQIGFLAVDTGDWWPDKKVLLAPAWVERVNGSDQTVTVNVTREQVRGATPWKPQKDGERSGDYLVAPDPPAPRKTKDSFIAVYDTHAEAEIAVRELAKSGFDMTKLSIVGKDYHTEEDVVGYYTAGERMKAWGATGAFWGGIWSLLFGSAFFLVPGIGPILVAGPVVAWIVGALESAVVVGGLSALGGALFSIGIPNDQILIYENHLKAGKFLVIAHDVTSAKDAERIAQEATRHYGLKKDTEKS